MDEWADSRSKRQYERIKEVQREVEGTLDFKICWRCRELLMIESFGWRTDKQKGRRAACLACEDPNGTKRCHNCLEIKPKSEFSYRKSGKYDHWQADCKTCQKIFMRKYRLLVNYGLTPEDYEVLLGKQDGCCAICAGVPAVDDVLRVDHDHDCCSGDKTCGKCIRGLLCDLCNRGLGYFQDDAVKLRTAIQYLERGVLS
jgi:hypothetical protein